MLHQPDIAGTPVSTAVMRVFDAAQVNAVVNHPAVLAGLSLGFDYLDVTPLIENPRNVFLMGEQGGAMFIWSAPGVYDAHDYFLPEGRGKWAMAASFAMLGIMFDAYGAEMIWAQTPIENRACRLFNRILGFKSGGTESAILIPGHPPCEVELFVLKGGDLPPMSEGQI